MTKDKQSLMQRLFINRDFALLFWGRLVSQVGDGVHYLALTWLVLDLTGSGTALGTMLFMSSIPSVLLAPFTGVLADLWDRKTIVVAMDIVRGLIILSLAAIFKAGHLTMPILYVATVFSSLCGVLFGPAVSATLPGLVKKDELVKANSLNNLSRATTMIIGPVFGAFLLGTTGYFGVFLINGIAFILSAISEMFIRFPKVSKGEQKGTNQFFTSLKDGFGYIWGQIGLRTLIFFAVALNFFSAPLLSVVLPYLGKEVFLLDANQYGTVQASLPLGFLVGTALIGLLTKKFRKEALLAFAIMLQGVIVLTMGPLALPVVYGSLSIPTILSTLAGSLFFIGILNTMVNVPFQVMLQETIPDNYRGRVFGLIDSMVQLLVPISMALSGPLVDSFSPTTLFVFSGLVSIVLGFGLAVSPSIKGLYTEVTASVS